MFCGGRGQLWDSNRGDATVERVFEESNSSDRSWKEPVSERTGRLNVWNSGIGNVGIGVWTHVGIT